MEDPRLYDLAMSTLSATMEARVEAMKAVYKIAWLEGLSDTLNALEGISPMLGKGTEYPGPWPDELTEWVSEQRDAIARLKEFIG